MPSYRLIQADGSVPQINLTDGADLGAVLAEREAVHGKPLMVLPLPLTVEQQATVDVAEAAYVANGAAVLNLARRLSAKALVDAVGSDVGKALRAEAAVIIDELNVLRQWLAAFKTRVAAATTLADFKARVATLPATPDRTLAQAKAAILAKIDTGLTD